jgi:hypothetical protein
VNTPHPARKILFLAEENCVLALDSMLIGSSSGGIECSYKIWSKSMQNFLQSGNKM